MDVLEGQNILITISGRKHKVRVYYLSWLKTKIFKTEGVSPLAGTAPENRVVLGRGDESIQWNS